MSLLSLIFWYVIVDISLFFLFSEVPKHKQRIAGKSIPFEKFAISRVEKYRAAGILVLPGLVSFCFVAFFLHGTYSVICFYPGFSQCCHNGQYFSVVLTTKLPWVLIHYRKIIFDGKKLPLMPVVIVWKYPFLRKHKANYNLSL